MLCERCHKRLATLRYSEVIDGKAIVRNICQNCLNEIQGNASTGFEMSGAAPTPRHDLFQRMATDRLARHIVCSGCGLELADALHRGVLGCPVCYDSFTDHLPNVLRGIQPGLRHRGKTPSRDASREQLHMQLQTKRALLRSALKTENYEDAAKLRDEIKALESTLNAGAPSKG
jgi:protein arginine kinase activator